MASVLSEYLCVPVSGCGTPSSFFRKDIGKLRLIRRAIASRELMACQEDRLKNGQINCDITDSSPLPTCMTHPYHETVDSPLGIRLCNSPKFGRLGRFGKKGTETGGKWDWERSPQLERVG